MQESVSQAIILLGAVIGFICSIVKGTSVKQNEGRFFSGLLLSVAGLSICWSSITLWTVFLGIFFVLLGNAIILFSAADVDDTNARHVKGFLIEHSAGFFVAVLGGSRT